MEDKKDRTEFYVGLFVFFGLLLLGALILTFGGIGNLFRDTYEISVKFSHVQSLREGSPVVRGGLTIGYVSTTPTLVEFDKVKVPLAIYREYEIPTGAEFKIETAGLMGDTFVAVVPPEKLDPAATPLEPGGDFEGSAGTGLGELSDQTFIVLQKIQKSLDDLNSAFVKVNQDILTSQNIENIQTSIASLNSTTIKVQEQYINDTNAENINEMLTSLKNTAQKLSAIVETLPNLISETTTTVKSIGPSVKEFSDEATQTAQSFQELAKSLEKLTVEVGEAEGAIPMLLRDPKVGEDIKALIHNLRVNGVLWYKNSYESEMGENVDPDPVKRSKLRLPWKRND